MKRDKMLAEWFWTDRWQGSSGFLLPLEPRGLYREMLTQAWQRGCSLPDDHEAIQRACGVTAAEWRRCWPKISHFWQSEAGRLYNQTQREVFEQARQASERASNRGREGAKARHKRGAQAPAQAQHEHSTSTAQAALKEWPPSPSPNGNGIPASSKRAREAPPESVPLSAHRPPVTEPAGRPANPLISPEQHRSNMALALDWVGKIAALTGEDPAEVFATASEYTDRHGNKRRAMNPAAMSPERLALTLSDLRGTLADAERCHQAGSRQSVAEITEHRRRLRQRDGGAA